MVFVAFPGQRGVGLGCAVVYDDTTLLLTPHQLHAPSGTVFVNGVEQRYRTYSKREGSSDASGWVTIEIEHAIEIDDSLEFTMDFSGSVAKGTPIYFVWYPQSIESLTFPIEHHLDDLNFTEKQIAEAHVVGSPKYAVRGDYKEFLLFQPALVDGASGAPAFAWDTKESCWKLIGILAGVMRYQPDDPRDPAPAAIGMIRRPHELE